MRLWWLIRWIEESDDRKRYKSLHRGCWHCELVGLPRSKENGWKCYNRCRIRIIKENREKY